MGNSDLASEAERLRALADYDVLDTPSSPEFDRLTQLAVRLFRVPIATITLVDERRQWFKSRVGLEITETPREIAFCAYTIRSAEVMVVPDARADVRFADSPLVVSPPHIRFYAGAPLTTRHGLNIGTVAVMDQVPRDLDPNERDLLVELANLVIAELELRRAVSGQLAAEQRRLDRREAENERRLRVTERRFAALVEHTREVVALLDRDGRTEYVTPSVERVLGYTQEEYLAQDLPDRVHPDDRADSAATFARVLAIPGATVEGSQRVRHKDGSWWRMVSVAHNLLEDPGVVAVVVNFRDVSELERRARQQAAVAELGLVALGQRDLPPLMQAAVERVVETLDAEYAGVFQLLPGGDAMPLRSGTGWREGQALLPAGEGSLAAFALSSGEPLIVEALREDERFVAPPLLLDHGVQSGISVLIAGQRGPHGLLGAHSRERATFTRHDADFLRAVAHVLGTKLDEAAARDQMRKHEEQIRQAQKMEAVGQLAGGIAHDFNNILTGILNYAQCVAEAIGDSSPARADVDQICAAAQRGAVLTRQVLAFSRQQVLAKADLDLNAVISNVFGLLRRTIGGNIEVIFQRTEGLWTIHADPGSLEQILVNFAVNARDAMPSGGRITIATANVGTIGNFAASDSEEALPGRHVLLTFADTGAGMPPEIVDRIFEPFFTTKGPDNGTGLGLSTVFGIVRQHEGTIRVTSEVGRGATFAVYLPAVDRPAARPGARPPLATRSAGSVGGSETVLVAEDNEPLRRAAVRILESAGYRVVAAADGEEAVALFEANEGAIALALLDVIMPHLGGPAVRDRLRARRPQLPVVLCTGYPGSGTEWAPGGDTEDLWIAKPYTAETLLRKVRDALDEAGAERA